MKTIKTYDLQGADLDWAVASIEKLPSDLLVWKDGLPVVTRTVLGHTYTLRCEFSTNWAQGGPIIERECMDISCLAGGDDGWKADKYLHAEMVECFGSTPLIAAMRCYVASKLGDEVSIPESDE